MKGALILAFFSALTVSNGLVIRGAPVCGPENDNELYPDPTNCKAYYHCSFGVASRVFCPGDLLFNAGLSVCDYPSGVSCDVATGAPQPTTAAPVPTTAAPQPSSAVPPASSAAPPASSAAPPASSAAPPASSAAPPATTAAPPATTAAPPATTAVPPPPPGDLSCPADSDLIYYPITGACSQFYLCRDGAYVGTYNCQQGLNFSPGRQACVRPEKYQC